MGKLVFTNLVQLIGMSYQPKKGVNLRIQVGLFLCYLGSQGSYRDVSSRFGVCKCSVAESQFLARLDRAALQDRSSQVSAYIYSS